MVCMACREARKHWKRLINERKQEKSPAHFNEKWCAAKCAWRAEGVQRTSEWHPFFLAYFFCLRLFQGARANFFELISAHKRAEIGSELRLLGN